MIVEMPQGDFDVLINRIRGRLPIQNPLHSFVHNNILLMFEGLDFHEALSEAGELYRARTYWPEEKYRARYNEGKMTDDDIKEALTALRTFFAIPAIRFSVKMIAFLT
jgi:hypothetical protein